MSIRLYILVFCVSVFISSCGVSYDKDYYERASGIKLPSSARPIESFDNGEFYTLTSFRIPADDMRSFIRTYAFEGITRSYRPTVFGAEDLRREKPAEKDFANCVYSMRSNGKLNSTYLADTVRGLLWASISYPDWGGD